MQVDRRGPVSRRGLIRGGALLGAAAAGVALTAGQASAAVVQLGLSLNQAKRVQRYWLRPWDYTGSLDGRLGTASWKAMQRFLKYKDRSYVPVQYTGAIDGVVGPGTVTSLQSYLKKFHGYTGKLDGVAGSGTQAAFRRAAEKLPAL
jgi:lysozyme family protein